MLDPGQVRFAVANDNTRRQKEAMKAAADRLQQAGDLVMMGKVVEAFAIYDELRGAEALRKSAEDAATSRIDALLRDLVEAQKHLGSMLPTPPTELIEQQQEAAAQQLQMAPEREPAVTLSAPVNLLTPFRVTADQSRVPSTGGGVPPGIRRRSAGVDGSCRRRRGAHGHESRALVER